jgi:hypothetical protein
MRLGYNPSDLGAREKYLFVSLIRRYPACTLASSCGALVGWQCYLWPALLYQRSEGIGFVREKCACSSFRNFRKGGLSASLSIVHVLDSEAMFEQSTWVDYASSSCVRRRRLYTLKKCEGSEALFVRMAATQFVYSACMTYLVLLYQQGEELDLLWRSWVKAISTEPWLPLLFSLKLCVSTFLSIKVCPLSILKFELFVSH